MKGFIGLTKRNLLIYFKDVQSVIFSLLTSIIVFALYLLFLKGNYVDTINSAIKGLENFVSEENVDMLVNCILLTGIVGSALITVPFNCLSTIVKDKENKIDFDISATPLKRWQIICSYFSASTISATVMTSIILTVGIIMLKSMGTVYMSGEDILKTYGIVVLGSISSTALFMIVMLFFKNSSASGAFFGMLSAASGFIIGAYIPISQFSDSVQTVCNIFPGSHITVLLRNTIMNGLLDEINTNIGGVDNGMFIDTMKDVFTFSAKLFGEDMTGANSMYYIGGFAVICIITMIILYSATYKRKN